MLGHLTSMVAIVCATYLAVTNFPFWWVFLLTSFLISIATIGTENDKRT